MIYGSRFCAVKNAQQECWLRNVARILCNAPTDSELKLIPFEATSWHFIVIVILITTINAR